MEVLFTSLLVQAQTALVNSGTKKHGTGRSRNKTFRQSFLSAFASRIGERLAEATAAAISQESASRGTDLVRVLAPREQEVEQAVEAHVPAPGLARGPHVLGPGGLGGRIYRRRSGQPRGRGTDSDCLPDAGDGSLAQAAGCVRVMDTAPCAVGCATGFGTSRSPEGAMSG
ncbi:hypothetical protein [Nonomuraea dietziae]|uniref:hypothetical protein n=1 Tax=Nonomuraea dietziae TaxID=65515 RepID=UPI0031DC2E5B